MDGPYSSPCCNFTAPVQASNAIIAGVVAQVWIGISLTSGIGASAVYFADVQS